MKYYRDAQGLLKKTPEAQNLPPGRWLPRNTSDMTDIVASLLSKITGEPNYAVNPLITSDPGVINKEQNLATQELGNLSTGGHFPIPDTPDYNLLSKTTLPELRAYSPEAYQSFMSNPVVQGQTSDLNYDVQKNTPYPTLLGENIQDKLSVPLQNDKTSVLNAILALYHYMNNAVTPDPLQQEKARINAGLDPVSAHASSFNPDNTAISGHVPDPTMPAMPYGVNPDQYRSSFVPGSDNFNPATQVDPRTIKSTPQSMIPLRTLISTRSPFSSRPMA